MVSEFQSEVRELPNEIRLFIKPYCGWCHKAEAWLDEHGIEYETLDVIADATAYDEMVKLSGQELAPVIDVDGKILADFGPEELAEFWKRLSTADGRWINADRNQKILHNFYLCSSVFICGK